MRTTNYIFLKIIRREKYNRKLKTYGRSFMAKHYSLRKKRVNYSKKLILVHNMHFVIIREPILVQYRTCIGIIFIRKNNS